MLRAMDEHILVHTKPHVFEQTQDISIDANGHKRTYFNTNKAKCIHTKTQKHRPIMIMPRHPNSLLAVTHSLAVTISQVIADKCIYR